jgi:hypothetical protein
MTKKIVAQGQGNSTEFKERGLQSAFKINMNVFNGVKAKHAYGVNWRYFHFDLNSGSGINQDVGCIGSPLAFLEAARLSECDNYLAGFCDTNEQALAELLKRPGIHQNPSCFCFHGDNSSLIEAIPSIISNSEKPKHAMGMVLSDPNGADIPFDGLEWLSKETPKIDFCLNWNSTQFKRNRGAFGDHRPTMEEAIDRLNKGHWLIRQPMGRWQWTLLIGRNTKIGEHPALGFYHLDSSKGQEIFRRCNFVKGIDPSRDDPFQQNDLWVEVEPA